MSLENQDGSHALHPRQLPQIEGHEKAIRLLAGAAASRRLHHSWLICGSFGIGKATLAYRFAAHLLSGGSGEGGHLDVDPNSATARWIASQSHPDLFVLERAFDLKSKKLKSEIAVSDARELLQFFSLTAGASPWRIAIVDTADDLNEESANTLLKVMEEPPPQAMLILVCNQPGRLLRTIRSRCSKLALQPLTQQQASTVVMKQVAMLEDVSEDQLGLALKLANGSPGQAMEFLTSPGARHFVSLLNSPSLTLPFVIELASRFSNRTANVGDYDVFWSLLENWVAERGRDHALNSKGSGLADAASLLTDINVHTTTFNLDRRHAVMKALLLLDEAQKAS